MKKNIIITVLCVLFAAQNSRAATVQYMNTDALAQHADRIWIARINEVTAHFLPDERRIVSDAKIQILDVIKGQVQDKLRPSVLRVSGGVVGDIGQQVLGSAKLLAGDKVLVFAEAHGHDAQGQDVYRVVGMAQGLFVVEQNAQGQDIVRQQLHGLRLLDKEGRTKAVAKNSRQSLQVFLQHLRRLISALEQ